MNALTKTEASELSQHERTIERGLGTFRDVGASLLAIRDAKLYRAEHKTFEAYCKDRWKMSRPRAYQLIEAADIASDLSTKVDIQPATEREARPLSALPKESRAEAWEEVIERAPVVNGAPKVTAKLVQEVVDEWQEEEGADEPEEMTDYLGTPVPSHAHKAFYDEPLIDTAIGFINAAVKAGGEVNDSDAGKFLNLKQYRALLKDAKALLEATRPFAVCPYCHGRKCSACAQIGVVPKEVHQQAQKGS